MRAQSITFPDGTVQTTAPVTPVSPIPAGTVTNFFQATAPTGWTQNTTYNNYAMRIVSGTGGGIGGSVAFTTAFASQTPAGSVSVNTSGLSAGATTLTTAQIPSHTHLIGSPADVDAPGGAWTAPGQSRVSSGSAGGGGSHTHTISGTATGSFTGTAINLAVQYLDNIICTKS